MELREFATSILEARSVEGKLVPPPSDWTDVDPGPPIRWKAPERPDALRIVSSDQAKVPHVAGMADPAQRVRILHAFTNHELQAVELNAWALLAFPETPSEFRHGVVRVLEDEQRHTRMYRSRLAHLGGELGEHPVSGYFWRRLNDIQTPLQYVCAMALTFENANLDHTLLYAEAARRAGDEITARTIEQVHRDEIEHVRFGWHWLSVWKEPEQTMWDAYCANVDWPLRPALARGVRFDAASRTEVGMDEGFIESLASTVRDLAPNARYSAKPPPADSEHE